VSLVKKHQVIMALLNRQIDKEVQLWEVGLHWYRISQNACLRDILCRGQRKHSSNFKFYID